MARLIVLPVLTRSQWLLTPTVSVNGLSCRRWSPATSGPPGPSMAIFSATDGPPGPSMAAIDGPPLPQMVPPRKSFACAVDTSPYIPRHSKASSQTSYCRKSDLQYISNNLANSKICTVVAAGNIVSSIHNISMFQLLARFFQF